MGITAQEANDNGAVLRRDLSVKGSDTLDTELVWRGQSVRVQHPEGQQWFTLIITEGSRELAAARLDVALVSHLADLLMDVSDRIVKDL